jgi:hypothetical protein
VESVDDKEIMHERLPRPAHGPGDHAWNINKQVAGTVLSTSGASDFMVSSGDTFGVNCNMNFHLISL